MATKRKTDLDMDGKRGRIAKLAYEKWQAAGEPPGDGQSFWLQAEQEIEKPVARPSAVKQPVKVAAKATPKKR